VRENEDTNTELRAIEALCRSGPINAHIIRVHEFWFTKTEDHSSDTYIRMEFCDGTLEQYLAKQSIIEPIELTEIMIQLLTGLYHCHVQGFCHRDLKLANGVYVCCR
jgi:serine/threonine protein kinase